MNPRDLEDLVLGLYERVRQLEIEVQDQKTTLKVGRFLGAAFAVALIGLLVNAFGHSLGL